MRYLTESFQEIEVTQDIPFAQAKNVLGETETLHMDIYAPKNDTETKRRVLFLVHGGGFRVGNDKRQSYIVKFAHWFAQRGYVVVSPDYTLYPREMERPSHDACAPEAARQCELARQYLLGHAQEWRIDPEKMAVGGGSAGGITGNIWCRIPGAFVAFIDFWGSLAHTSEAESYPPTFIVHGTNDALVNYDYSVQLKKQLDEAGVPCELFTIEGAGHTPIAEMENYLPRVLNFLNNCFESDL